MTIGVIGLNHDTATIPQREALSLYDMVPVLKNLISAGCGLEEAALLSTCGRYEVYYTTAKAAHHEVTHELKNLLMSQMGNATSDVLYVYSHGDAAHHLFHVTCGLDSAVIGEDQILGQVKNCVSIAQSQQISGKILNKLFREAVSFAKSAKSEFKISENPLSLSYIAIKKAIESGHLASGAVVTMVGLGKMGTLAINYVLEQPVEKVMIAVRSPEKLPLHILEHPKVRIAPFEARYQCVLESDVVIASTSAPHTVLRADDMKGVKDGALWIDLSMPRDIDPHIETQYPITLWHVDFFKDISEANIQHRQMLMALIKGQMNGSVEQFVLWLEALEIDDLFRYWQANIKALAMEGIQMAERRGLVETPDKKQKLEAVFETVLKRMVKSPLVNLKSVEDKVERERYVKILKALYDYES